MKPNQSVKQAALKAWKHVADGKQLSPLMTAIGQAIESMTDDDATWDNARMMDRFAVRIARRAEESYRGCKTLDYCDDWAGEWHVTNNDLLLWSLFRMWINRSECDQEFSGITFQRVTIAMRQKRMFQAWQRYQATGLTVEHCNLLAAAGWEIDTSRNDWVSLFVQGKRPFGNSSIDYDIYQHAGWPMDWPGDEGPSEAQTERAWDLFDELAFAAVDAAKLAGEALRGKTNESQ